MNRRGCAVALVILLAAGIGCRRSGASDPARESAHRANNLGIALLEQFKYPEAADAFREALRIDGSLAMARVNLSLALLYALDLPGATREATEAARVLPSAPHPHYILGMIARAENRRADAQSAFERVRQMDDADVGADINLGQIYLEDRRYADATEVLRRAHAAEPYNVTAAYNLGLALTRNGQGDEGRRMLEQAQALRTAGYAVTYGTGYLEQGRYAEALASTGAEAALVEMAVPPVTFAPSAIGSANRASSVPESPLGRQFAAGDLTPAGMQGIATGLGGGVTLADIDNDGDLDLFTASANGQQLFRNDGGAAWTEVTEASGLTFGSASVVPIGCVAGDVDNDGMTDLFVLRYGGASALYRNEGNSRFTDVAVEAGVPAYPFLPGAAALVDVDHDGDLDLLIAGLADLAATRQLATRPLVFPRDFAPAPLRLMRNNGNGTFSDVTAAANLTSTTHAIALVPTDFDNRRDIDLLVVNHDAPPLLFQNLRDGTFREVAAASGLGDVGAAEITAVTAADVNKDEFPDFFFARAGGGVFATSDGRGGFTISAAPEGVDAARAAQFLDYDNDGLLDLLTWSASGPGVARNVGNGWVNVSGTATPRSAGAAVRPPSSRGLALADLNGDGSTDLITGDSGALTFWRSSGTSRIGRRSLRAGLRGRVSNRLGVGAKVQLRAGSLTGRLETSAATPAIAPADLVFGLGARLQADVVRALWPSGILQAETVLPAAEGSTNTPIVIEELNRKPSSCPFLYTWNGERFEFVTDFLGAGEMGYWAGPGVEHKPDPVEFVRIRGDQLQARDGALAIRVTNELEEALFVDRLRLLAIAHPRGIEVYPNEGMTDPPKPFKLFAVAGSRVPRAFDDRGRDVTDRISRIDRRYVDDFALERFRGYAASHSLTLDLAPVGQAPVLLLTGWTDYAFSSDNVAAHQSGLSLSPPSLQIKEASGRWRTAVADIGIPVGRPQTVPVDLSALLLPGEHEIRIVTNMRIYWDQVAVARAVSPDGLITQGLDPQAAVLRARGFSHEVRPGGTEPAGYQYDRVAFESPWKVMTGRYTREGNVLELLTRADDMFVIAKPGDEIALEFGARLAATSEEWTRTYLLMADGYSKEMDIHSASPDTVEPLPFHEMTAYPYRAPEHYPDSPEHQRYRATYNTRAVLKPLPSMAGAGPK